MEANINYGKPKKVKLPRELNDFLLNACKKHLIETNKSFTKELIQNKTVFEEFHVIGEFTPINGELYITVRATKSKTTYPKNSIVVPSGVSQNTLLASSTT